MNFFFLSMLFVLSSAHVHIIHPQSNTFNSSFSLSESQITAAGLSNITANNINIALRFERTNWATASVHTDPFYTVPTNASHLPPGSLLKLEEYTDTTTYTLPPNVALSRLLYQSTSFHNSPVPASAYILWPWQPRLDPQTGKYAVVGWAHGTSGVFPECAPSHIRNLWYQYSAPYILALQGYVVVGPDYQGLGVAHYANGTAYRHPYLNNAVAADDLFYAVQAAQQAFASELSERFVLMGHSQGGGAAWGAAQRQLLKPMDGYLGTIAGSPITDIIPLLQQTSSSPEVALNLAYTLPQVFPNFSATELLTEKGQRHLKLAIELQACNSVVLELTVEKGLLKPGWETSASLERFQNLTRNGGRPIAGPMLVLQGTEDSQVPFDTTSKAVNDTCSLYPDSELEYAVFEGSDHVPTLYASQRIWLDWIQARFEGEHVAASCSRKLYKPARKLASYQKELAMFLEIAREGYEVA